MIARLLIFLVAASLHGATATNPPARPAGATNAYSSTLFADEVLCRGKGVEVSRSQLDSAFLQFRASATLRGQTIPENRRTELENALLDRLVVTRLLVHLATDEDKRLARARADKYLADTKQQAGSDAAYRRQLASVNYSEEDFASQVYERAICEEVVDRELKGKVRISDEETRRYYDANAEKLRRPEMVRVSHILIATRDLQTGAELSAEQKTEKLKLTQSILDRARKGEDFAALVKEFSQDPGSNQKGGEYVFSRGQMAPEFELASFSMQTNQISDVVTTSYGYHIIKLLQRIPSEQIEYDRVRDDVREKLEHEEVQNNLLPPFLEQLKKEANLEYFHGARPPAPAEAEDQAPGTNAPAAKQP